MTQRIEFTNQPPTVTQCPKLELRLLARSLVEATRDYKNTHKGEKEMKYDYFGEYKPHWEANVWIRNGKGDPLFLESYTTKREAVSAIKKFVKSYKGGEELDCFVNHFDETMCTDDLGFDVEVV